MRPRATRAVASGALARRAEPIPTAAALVLLASASASASALSVSVSASSVHAREVAVDSVGAASTVGDAVPPERTFGRLLGDVLTQRVPIDAAAALEPGTAPAEGRVDVWFARLPTRRVRTEDGGVSVELRYQIVNSPKVATVTTLPATVLTLTTGQRVEVPSVPVSIAPLVPAAADRVAADRWPALRPDRLLPPLDTAVSVRRARLSALALCVVLSAWFAWWVWRRRRDSVRLPFACAAAELRAFASRPLDADPRAWRVVHGALNATAGRSHHPGGVEALLTRAPWLAAYRDRLDAFHDASAGRFFEQPPRIEPFDLRAFVRDLHRAERRQAR